MKILCWKILVRPNENLSFFNGFSKASDCGMTVRHHMHISVMVDNFINQDLVFKFQRVIYWHCNATTICITVAKIDLHLGCTDVLRDTNLDNINVNKHQKYCHCVLDLCYVCICHKPYTNAHF